ncbi:hypothetical protein BS78_05G105700 [Paspalum vaginatum]|nr:hypothetical protein BS78_05G105700 [Paspalum vaginatum]
MPSLPGDGNCPAGFRPPFPGSLITRCPPFPHHLSPPLRPPHAMLYQTLATCVGQPPSPPGSTAAAPVPRLAPRRRALPRLAPWRRRRPHPWPPRAAAADARIRDLQAQPSRSRSRRARRHPICLHHPAPPPGLPSPATQTPRTDVHHLPTPRRHWLRHHLARQPGGHHCNRLQTSPVDLTNCSRRRNPCVHNFAKRLALVSTNTRETYIYRPSCMLAHTRGSPEHQLMLCAYNVRRYVQPGCAAACSSTLPPPRSVFPLECGG